MSLITTEPIATSRYAPDGARDVQLYATTLATSLTLGQLVMAVSLRAAAAYESESVIKMNRMASGSTLLDTASTYMQDIAEETVTDWSAAKKVLKDTVGVTEGLPDSIDSYANRMAAITAIKTRIDALTQQQQQAMIDLQTLVNRRDVAYAASSNIVKTIGNSQSNNATNI